MKGAGAKTVLIRTETFFNSPVATNNSGGGIKKKRTLLKES